MKLIQTLIILLILYSCSSSRYSLTDSGTDKKFVTELITDLSEKGKISKKPMIVLDGVPLRYGEELKENGLQISKDEIAKIDVLKKDIGIQIYGENGEAGVILITTKSSQKP